MPNNLGIQPITTDLVASDTIVNNGEQVKALVVKVVLGGQGVNGLTVGTTNPMPTFSGGSATTSIASAAGSTTIKSTPGRLHRIIVTTAGTGTGNVTFTDGASGTVIWSLPATVSVNTSYIADMPAAISLICVNVASGPVLTVSYS